MRPGSNGGFAAPDLVRDLDGSRSRERTLPKHVILFRRPWLFLAGIHFLRPQPDLDQPANNFASSAGAQEESRPQRTGRPSGSLPKAGRDVVAERQ
jgi:hypothetical protein